VAGIHGEKLTIHSSFILRTFRFVSPVTTLASFLFRTRRALRDTPPRAQLPLQPSRLEQRIRAALVGAHWSINTYTASAWWRRSFTPRARLPPHPQ